MATVAGGIFLTLREIHVLRERVASDALARGVAEQAIGVPARQAVDAGLLIPPPHEHRYLEAFCPHTGAAAVFRRSHPHEHRTEAGTVMQGPAADRGWCTWMHNSNANDARTCALAAALLNDTRAAEHARLILQGYAEQYLSYPPLGRLVASWGRVQTSGLEEAIWGLSLLWTADLLHQIGRLGDAELDTLRLKLFEPLIDLLWGEWYHIHNIRMWINAYIGSAGLLFGDRACIRHAIYGDKGYRQQLVDGFRADGFHFEGSPGYHAYGATAMLMLAEAMERQGLVPYRESFLRRAMLVPFQIVQPDGTLPPLNDYWSGAQPPSRVAATLLARYDDAEVRAIGSVAFARWWGSGAGADAAVAAFNRTPAYFGRSQVDWLLAWDRLGTVPARVVGSADHPLEPWPSLGSEPVELRDSGVGIVRRDSQDYTLLKASRRGSGHDHHDKLSLILWSAGTCWLGDKGSGSYTSAMHESWFKHTLSHNTVLIDGVKHERTDAHLETCTREQLSGWAKPYPEKMPDVRLHRRVTISSEAVWRDTFSVQAQQRRTIDYVLHPAGELVEHPPVRAVSSELLQSDASYAHLEQVRQVDIDPQRAGGERSGDGVTLGWRKGGARLLITLMRLPEGAQVFLAQVPSDAMDRTARSTSLIIRCLASEATFEVEMRSATVIPAPRVQAPLALAT